MWKNTYEFSTLEPQKITSKSITVRNFYTRFFYLLTLSTLLK